MLRLAAQAISSLAASLLLLQLAAAHVTLRYPLPGIRNGTLHITSYPSDITRVDLQLGTCLLNSAETTRDAHELAAPGWPELKSGLMHTEQLFIARVMASYSFDGCPSSYWQSVVYDRGIAIVHYHMDVADVRKCAKKY